MKQPHSFLKNEQSACETAIKADKDHGELPKALDAEKACRAQVRKNHLPTLGA